MTKEGLKYLHNIFGEEEITWVYELWELCESSFAKLCRKKKALSKKDISKGVNKLHFIIYKQIFLTGFKDTPYLDITPPIKAKFEKFAGVRTVQLDSESVTSLIDSFLFSGYFILGKGNLEIDKNEFNKYKKRYEEMSGGKKDPKDVLMYEEIIRIRKEKDNEISWRQATINYTIRHKKQNEFTDKQIYTKSELARRHNEKKQQGK